MKRLLATCVLVASSASAASAQAYFTNLSYYPTLTTSAALTAGTTVPIASPTTANSRLMLFYAGAESTGAQNAATLNFEWGTGPTCGNGTVTLLPTAVSFTGASGQVTSLFAGVSQAAAGTGLIPSAVPLLLPIGASLCVVPAGTTFAGTAFVMTSQPQL